MDGNAPKPIALAEQHGAEARLANSRGVFQHAALANMSGTGGQLRFHLGAAMNTGLTETQMKDFISVLRSEIGEQPAEAASKLLSDVLSARNR